MVVLKGRAEVHHSLKMRVETATADLIAARFGVGHFAQTRQERTDEHHRTTQFIAFLEEIRAAQIGRIEVAGGEGKLAFREFLYRHSDRRE